MHSLIEYVLGGSINFAGINKIQDRRRGGDREKDLATGVGGGEEDLASAKGVPELLTSSLISLFLPTTLSSLRPLLLFFSDVFHSLSILGKENF
jgi:hypothetical protein